MNESELSRFPPQGPTPPLGIRIWRFVQAVLAPLLVMLVTALIFDRNSAWDRIRLVEHDLEIHAIDGKRRHALLDKQIEEILRDLDPLGHEIAECQLAQARMQIQIVELSRWQDKILMHEKDIATLKSKLETVENR